MSFQGRKEVEDVGKQIVNNNLQGVCTVFRRLPTEAVNQCRFSGREGTDSTTFYKMSEYYLSKEGRLVEKIHCRKTQHMVH